MTAAGRAAARQQAAAKAAAAQPAKADGAQPAAGQREPSRPRPSPAGRPINQLRKSDQAARQSLNAQGKQAGNGAAKPASAAGSREGTVRLERRGGGLRRLVKGRAEPEPRTRARARD